MELSLFPLLQIWTFFICWKWWTELSIFHLPIRSTLLLLSGSVSTGAYLHGQHQHFLSPLVSGWLQTMGRTVKIRERKRSEVRQFSQPLPCKMILDDCNSPQKLLSWVPFHTAPCICRSWWPSPSEAYKCLLWLIPRTAPSLIKFPVSYPNRTAICSARALTAALGKCNKWARQPWVLFWCL